MFNYCIVKNISETATMPKGELRTKYEYIEDDIGSINSLGEDKSPLVNEDPYCTQSCPDFKATGDNVVV